MDGEHARDGKPSQHAERSISEPDMHFSAPEGKNRFLKTLIRSLPGVFYLFDQNLRLLRWNENLEKVSGYSRDQLAHSYLGDHFPKEDWETVKTNVLKAFSEGEVVAEARLMTAEGKAIPYLFSGVSTTIEDMSYALGMGIDLSELKQTQDSLRESEAFYRVLAECMTIGAMLCQDSKIVFTNDALVSILEYNDPGELLGKDVTDLVAAGFETYFRQMFEALQKGLAEQRSFETRCSTNAGREIWIEGRARLITWKGIPSVFMTARDITEKKQREISIEEEAERLRRENINLRFSIKDRYRFGDIIGKSPAMQQVYELIMNAAGANASVIIYGESGTGKELVAKAIHDTSNRSARTFVPVNCAAIPENLLESEFFGHKKGAFTGAHADKPGYLDLANGGTLFLDEVGELNLNLQVKLLRALEGGGYSPVGSSPNKFSDFRIIASTNRKLIDQVREGTFREDFFYRIHVIPITVPPLRKRREDIPLLIEHFLKLFSEDGKLRMVPGQVLETLISYDWPGNVRELQNAIQRYLVVGSLEFIPTAFYDGTEPGEPQKTRTNKETEEDSSLSRSVAEVERAFIRKALEQHRWNKNMAAKTLGISRRTLSRKLKRLDLS